MKYWNIHTVRDLDYKHVESVAHVFIFSTNYHIQILHIKCLTHFLWGLYVPDYFLEQFLSNQQKLQEVIGLQEVTHAPIKWQTIVIFKCIFVC